jgi:hypothetical protein
MKKVNSNLRVHKGYIQQVGVVVILYTSIRNVSCSDVIFINETPTLLRFFLVLVGKARLVPSNIYDQGQVTWRASRQLPAPLDVTGITENMLVNSVLFSQL